MSRKTGSNVCCMNNSSVVVGKILRRTVAGLFFLGMGVGCSAGLLEDDEARKAILELRQRVENMRQTIELQQLDQQRKVADEVAQLRRSLVDLQNQIENLRTELGVLRGQVEPLPRELAALPLRHAEQIRALNERLQKLEPTRVTVDGKEFDAEPAERRDFDAAMAIFKKGDFTTAQALWSEFGKRYPLSGYRISALFWLGNAQYATRDYKEAIANFKSLLLADPQHLRAPETLLSIANCQLELKDAKAAKKTLDDLVRQHPQSDAGAAAKERLTKLK